MISWLWILKATATKTQRPVEISVCEFSHGGFVREHHWLINPERPISYFARVKHGIGDRKVRSAPPGLAFTYAPGRGGLHAERILRGFTGILQVDGYAGYIRLIVTDRAGRDIQLPTVGHTRGGS